MCECVTVYVCVHAHTFLPADVCKFMCVGVQFVCVCVCVSLLLGLSRCFIVFENLAFPSDIFQGFVNILSQSEIVSLIK